MNVRFIEIDRKIYVGSNQCLHYLTRTGSTEGVKKKLFPFVGQFQLLSYKFFVLHCFIIYSAILRKTIYLTNFNNLKALRARRQTIILYICNKLIIYET